MTSRPADAHDHRRATFAELMAHQADDVREIAGADRSNWRGTYEGVSERRLRGRATWAGRLQYDHREVIGCLQEMYERAGQRHDEPTLIRYRSALRTVVHENAHLLSARGTTHTQGKMAVESQPETHALEEGVTELWAQRNLNAFHRQNRPRSSRAEHSTGP